MSGAAHWSGDETIGHGVRAAYDGQGAAYAEAYPAAAADIGDLLGRFAGRVGRGPAVLDAGCGAGRYMAALEGEGMEVTGIDFSPTMLNLADEVVRGELLVMDMRRLAFADASFGGVWCASSLHHLSKRAGVTALEEMYRVLTPGGTIFLGVKEGRDAGWECGDEFGATARFFARYQLDEAERVLAGVGFVVSERARSGIRDSRSRRWLRLLATRPGPGR